MNIKENRIASIFVLSAILYVTLQYFTQRTQTLFLIIEYATLFVLYISILRISSGQYLFNLAIIFSILFRALLIPAIPNLSDDFYRFIWDGQLLQHGIDAYHLTPREVMVNFPGLMDQALFSLLNSPDYNSVYPPLLEGIFTLSVYLSPGSILGSVVVLKSIIFIAELISIGLLIKLCTQLKIKRESVLIYALNPLVIIELTGNVHFEALAIPFVLMALVLYRQSRNLLSGIALGFAASIKLLPAIFAAAFVFKFEWKKVALWTFGFLMITGISLFPIVSNQFEGIGSGLGLYFRKFEFNASIYYLVREVGYWIKGYNTIATIGPALGIMSFFSIIGVSIFYSRKKLTIEEALLFSLMAYLVFATTVHPWYIIPLIAFAVLTRFQFPLVWSFMIFLTYAGYAQNGYAQYPPIIIAEYLIIFGFASYEIRKYLWKRTVS